MDNKYLNRNGSVVPFATSAGDLGFAFTFHVKVMPIEQMTQPGGKRVERFPTFSKFRYLNSNIRTCILGV